MELLEFFPFLNDDLNKLNLSADPASCPLAAKWDTKGHEGAPFSCLFVSQPGAGGELHDRCQGAERETSLHRGLSNQSKATGT